MHYVRQGVMPDSSYTVCAVQFKGDRHDKAIKLRLSVVEDNYISYRNVTGRISSTVEINSTIALPYAPGR